jgi:hypothetical protein
LGATVTEITPATGGHEPTDTTAVADWPPLVGVAVIVTVPAEYAVTVAVVELVGDTEATLGLLEVHVTATLAVIVPVVGPAAGHDDGKILRLVGESVKPGGATETVTLAVTEPPGPVQVRA